MNKYRHVLSGGKFKMDWMHSPKPEEPPCPSQKGMTPAHGGKPANPEFRYYYLYFLTKEDAEHCAIELKLAEENPDFRIYPHEQVIKNEEE